MKRNEDLKKMIKMIVPTVHDEKIADALLFVAGSYKYKVKNIVCAEV